MNARDKNVVLVLDSDFGDLSIEEPILRQASLDVQMMSPGALATLSEETRDRTVGLLVQWTEVTEPMLELFPSLQVVGRIGLGVDSVDLKAATARGIWVVSSGDYATEEVAAHALTLMLAHLRRLPEYLEIMAEGSWQAAHLFAGIPRLSNLTVGLVGQGRIGCRFGDLCVALGMNVVAFDPYVQSHLDSVDSLDTLLELADIVSLHVPLTDDTFNLMGAAQFAGMKPGAVLINVSRGGLVDEKALLEALESGQLSGAALDVVEVEPMPENHPFRSMPQVLVTPHVAYGSSDALRDARSRPVEDIVAVLRGEIPRSPANQPKRP